MELNRDQIVKALECCVKSECNKCPLRDGRCANGAMGRLSLAIIKELTQANEMLSESYDHLEKTKDDLLAERARLTEDNERLHASCTELTRKMQDNVRAENDELRKSSECDVRKFKADTVRKYKSAVIEYYSKPKYQPTKEHPIKHTQIDMLFAVLDQIAKEIVEGG